MSQHTSLKISSGGRQQRSVLKRHERIRILQEKKLWDDVVSIFHLPKVKTVKIKVKKGTAAGAPAEAGAKATGATPTAAAPTAKTPTAGTPSKQPATPTKGAQTAAKSTPKS